MLLHERIAERVDRWRAQGYPCDDHPAVGEILRYARVGEGRRFLRAAQLRALEIYWYLRLVEGTPRLLDLNRRLYPQPAEQLAALGLDTDALRAFVSEEGMDRFWARVRRDDSFVRRHRLQPLREAAALAYPSYILALTMGAGKTVLLGAIIASEFALALEYHPGADGPFMQNALVFAPGLTIVESLRELAEIEYAQILPPHLYAPFAATHRLIFTADGQRDITAVPGSRYNIIVTNTEKIRIQARVRRHHTWTDLQYGRKQAEAGAEANLRLQTLASLPNLGIFSDEAHHTYGGALDRRFKRVRQTVDYLHANTRVIAAVNTTGTPFHKRRPLPDVILWYGLAAGIRDGILKSLHESVYAYELADSAQFVTEVIRDFFETYGTVALPNGAPARLALYFPSNAELNELRPVIERTLWELGHGSELVLRNTSQSSEAEIDAFRRLNEPNAPHRVILLVNKGTEGWNCPSLFACALVRTLRESRNFVLQAATRCLRQVPGNTAPARIYLSPDNARILARQLRQTYGERMAEIRRTVPRATAPPQKTPAARATPAPVPVAPAAPHSRSGSLRLTLPDGLAHGVAAGTRRVYDALGGELVLQQTQGVAGRESRCDLYRATVTLATTYRLDPWPIYDELARLYGTKNAGVPVQHLPALAAQIERQLAAEPATERGSI